MALASKPIHFNSERPLVGITNLGVLTQGTMKAMQLFEEQGYDCIVFHAIGAGGSAMEQMVKEGIVKPALIIGIPVGFICAAESKAELAKLDEAPFITNIGRKGGSSSVSATINALFKLIYNFII